MKRIKNHMVLMTLFFFVGYTINAAVERNNTTIVQGEFTYPQEIQTVKLLKVEEGKTTEFSRTKVSDENKFAFIIPSLETGFYYIDYGQMSRNIRGRIFVRLYLEPDQNINLEINEADYIINGTDVGYNKLVSEANKLVDRYNYYNTLGGPVTYEDFFPFIDDEAIPAYKKLKSSINTGDTDFNKLMKLAVTADFEDALYDFFHFPRRKHPDMDSLPDIYDELLQPEEKFHDVDILKLGNGYDWMSDYFFFKNMRNRNRTVSIKNEVEHIGNRDLKEIYIREALSRRTYSVPEYKLEIVPLHKYLTSDKSKALIVDYEKKMYMEEGQPGFEFTYNDNKGHPVSFSDFRGKLVYIDVWATWCGPCLNEIPHLKKIEEEFEGEDIVFMSLSVDEPEDKQKWLDMIEEKELGGVQLMADKAFESAIAKNYEINAIPRFLLFDKEGKIISTKALRPSNKLLKDWLRELLH